MQTSNTANPTRIERERLFRRPFALSPGALARMATILSGVMFAVVIISFRPYQPAGAELQGDGGDTLNQLGFGALGAIALFGLLALVDRRVLSALLSPSWLLLLFFLAMSVLTAPATDEAMRGAVFTVIGILTMAAVLTMPRDAESFSAMLAASVLVILAFSYYGILMMPEVAIHPGGGVEPQHAGLWRGSFSHKNIAAPVMACLSFAGIYLFRRGWRASGALIFVLAVFFMSNTGSKTTLGTIPLAMFLVMLPGICGMRFLAPVFLVAALVGMGLATLGIVFIEPLAALHKELMPDLTYTGRTALWEFMGEMLAKRPWTGYGFGSFWDTEVVMRADQPFDRDWDIRGIVHGHNSYLDLAITMGLPALAVAIFAFVIAPLRDFLRVPPLRESIFLAEFFLMIAAFTLLNAFLETFFFRRADPVWLLLVFALLGLRLVARFPVPTKRPI